MAEMMYCHDGRLILDPRREIFIDPTLEWCAREMWSFLPVAGYAENGIYSLPVDGELGLVGNCRLILSGNPSAIKGKKDLKIAVFGPERSIEELEAEIDAYDRARDSVRT